MEAAPAASKRRRLRAARLSRSSMGVRASTIAPAGTLTKKIHDQPKALVSAPPSRTPAAAPLPEAAPQTPSARLRSRPSANVVVRMDRAAGESNAAPSPWRARKPIREPSDQARPLRSELTVKRTSPATKTRRRPSRSASRPPSSSRPPKRMAYAVTTHCRLSWLKWRSVLIDGRATFTIATSRTTMNCAATIRARANHRFRFSGEVIQLSYRGSRTRTGFLATRLGPNLRGPEIENTRVRERDLLHDGIRRYVGTRRALWGPPRPG